MNTKKILAVSLAATTAFSMFGAAMSVGAAYSDAYVPYKSPVITTVTEVSSVGTDMTITDTAGGNSRTHDAATLKNGGSLSAFTNFYNDMSMIALASDGAPVGVGTIISEAHIYLYDYTPIGGATLKNYGLKIRDFLRAYESLSATPGDAAKLTSVQNAAEAVIKDFGDYYKLANVATGGTVELVNNTTGAGTASRMEAYSSYLKTWDAANELVQNNYNPTDWSPAGYNMATLKTDIVTGLPKVTAAGVPTSRLVYLTQTYNRIVEAMNTSDPDTLIVSYEREMAKLSSRVRDDYSATNSWIDFNAFLEKARIEAAKGTHAGYTKALDYLRQARDIVVIRPDVSELGTLLESVYRTIPSTVGGETLDDGSTTLTVGGKVANMPSVYYDPTNMYARFAQSYAAYPAADYYRYNDTLNRPLVIAYTEAFVNDLSNYNESAYTEAMNAYKNVTSYQFAYTTSKSEVQKAYNRLVEALDALGAVNGPSSWDQLKLETFVDEISALSADDYYTTRNGYKTFMTFFASAEKIAAKSNPSKTEVTNILNKLVSSFDAFDATRKPVSYELRKELTTVLKQADDELSAISNESGAQYVALSKAIDAAKTVSGDRVPSSIASDGARLATSTDFSNAIASVEKAILGFTQPQGWYQADGKWMYGEDDTFYVDSWKQIGKTWFYFNADGTAKQSEWFQMDGKWYYANSNCGLATGWAKVDGKWYFFKGNNAMKTGWEKVDGQWYYMNSSGAMVTGWAQIDGKYYYFSKASNALGQMATNTTIDGYKIDANGVWVK